MDMSETVFQKRLCVEGKFTQGWGSNLNKKELSTSICLCVLTSHTVQPVSSSSLPFCDLLSHALCHTQCAPPDREPK